MQVTIRNGGHSAYGFSVGQDCLVMDMRSMKRMRLSDSQNSVTVDAGVLSGELDDFLAPYSKAIPLGDCPGVGVAGIALGGGNGFLSRMHGLTCDRLRRCTIVSVDGEVHDVSDSTHPDLMWAIRGGGQCNFGVVSEMEFNLCDVPDQVVVGSLFFALEDAISILPKLVELLDTAPDELSLFIRMNREVGQPAIRIYGVCLGDVALGEKYFKEIESWSRVLSKDVRVCSYREAQRVNASSVVDGVSFHWENAMIRHELDEAFVGAMIESFHSCPNDYGRINLDPMGGMIKGSADLNSCFAHRKERYILSIIGVWPEKGSADGMRDWVEKTYEKLLPWCQKEYRYTNYVHPEAKAEAYFGDNVQRLEKIHDLWDPNGVLRGILGRGATLTFGGSAYI